VIVVRSVIFNIVAYASFVLIALLGVPFLITERGALYIAKKWASMNVWTMQHVAGIKLEVRGLEHVPQGGCLIASKHQSALETFAMTPMIGDFAFILKRELNWVPLFGWYTARSGMIPVDRGARSAALRQIVHSSRIVLAKGRKIIIFPEGTRRPPGAEPDYKFGIVQLYAKLDTVCVPVAVNSGLFWPRRSFLRYPGTTVIEFLPPIPPGLDSHTFRARLQNDIETASNRLMAEARARGEGIPPDQIKMPDPVVKG
jgi:1-acyl-sn-glycerol-3-phosphate acyltransferase